MIPITLTKPEARLCREAAKLAESSILVGDGEQRLPYGDWCDLEKFLTWRATDFEIVVELTERKTSEALAGRIERILEAVKRELGAEPVKAVKAEEKQGSLF